MNKKGFAISVVLYAMVILVIGIFYLLLGIVKNRYTVLTDLKSSIIEIIPDNPEGSNPIIVYSLAEGTYNENKTVTVTITDSEEIVDVEYKLYKDGVLSESGNPTLANKTNVTFDVNLNSNGIWVLSTKALNKDGNYNNIDIDDEGYYSKEYIILVEEEEENCCHVLDYYYDSQYCGASGSEEDDTYTTCQKIYGYNVMYIKNSNPTEGYQSCYTASAVYSSETNALNVCKDNYISHCYNRYHEYNDEGTGKKYYLKCETYYGGHRNYVYKKVCGSVCEN